MFIKLANKRWGGTVKHWRTGFTFKNITTQEKNHLKERKIAIGTSVIYSPLSVIIDFIWRRWELTWKTTDFQEKGLK